MEIMEVIPISISNTPASLGRLFLPYAPEFSVFLSESNSLRLSYSSNSKIEDVVSFAWLLTSKQEFP